MPESGELSPEQRELFARLMARGGDHRLTARPGGETMLSFAQERIYFLEKLGPCHTAYTVSWGFDVFGEFDLDRFKEAYRMLRNRHEVMRARCLETPGGPRLEFDPPGEPPIVELDYRGLSPEEVTQNATRLIRAPFDLVQGNLSKLTLIAVDEDHHVVILHSHHLVVDSWSAKVLLQELSLLYADLLQGRAAELPALPLSYADFAHWQRQRVEAGNWKGELGYWLAQLEGAPDCLTLPTDYPRPPFRSYRGRKCHFKVDPVLADRLKAYARHRGSTLFSLFLALFQAYLGRLSGQRDLVVGAALSDRFPAETERMVGSFAHLLPLRGRLEGGQSLNDFLPRVRRTVAEALAHKELPFERLVDELSPPRNLNHDPIFQVMFVLHENPLEEELQVLGCRVKRRVLEKGGSRFDLMLEMVSGEDELFGWFEYSLDLYEPATVQQMVEQFLRFTDEAVGSPDQPLESLSLLPESHRVAESQGEEFSVEATMRVEEMVYDQARAHPDRRSVDGLTYQQLLQRTEQRAAELSEQGLTPGQLVGLISYKNTELLVTMLAVWKCGAAFLPLSPDGPQPRIEAIVAAAGCHWRHHPDMGAVLKAGPGSAVLSSERAYAMATSGSTGRPKVVAVGHRALANLLLSMRQRPGFGPEDHLVSVTTPTFDISLLEFFLPLISGGSVTLLSDQVKGGCGLRQALQEHRPSVVQATPTLWRMLLESGWRPGPELKILCGGEGLPRELAERLTAAGSVWNLYGPTETTIWSALHQLTEVGPLDPPIGRPIANTVIELRDPLGQPVPRGVVGEIFIGGLGLAQGYLGSEQPLAVDGFYATGDLGRWDVNHQLRFEGRRDDQVKVRGVRIELGEVEHALGQHPAVEQAVVVARGDELAAFLVGESTAAGALQSFLRRSLPDTYVPSSFHFLEQLPRTANGKIDRRALDPARGRTAPAGSTFRAPQTPTEERVVELFEEILERRGIGCEDDFFALGGHSLLAISLVARLERAFETRFPLRQVFQLGTPTRMSAWLEEQILQEIEALSEEEAAQLALSDG